MNNRKHATELVMLMVGLTVLVCSSAQACITQVGQDGLALHAGKEIWLGAGTTVNGDIAAIGQISADSGSSLQNVTSMSGVWVGSNVQIRGDVVAGGAANAGSGLDLEGTWSGASVGLGRDARVTGSVLGGSVSIDRNARIDGSVRSNSTLWIDRDGSVTGDATPGLGYKISTGKKVSIGGSTAPAAVQIPAPEVDRPEVSISNNYSWNSLWISNNSTKDIETGSYGTVTTGNQVSLNLSSGVYDFAGFWMGNNGVVNIDTTAGDVTVNCGAFATGVFAEFNVIGDGDFVLNVKNGDVYFGHDSTFVGQVTQQNGNFGSDHSLNMLGAVCTTGTIGIGANSTITYSPMAGEVPEPATVVMICLGGMLLLKRRSSPLRA